MVPDTGLVSGSHGEISVTAGGVDDTAPAAAAADIMVPDGPELRPELLPEQEGGLKLIPGCDEDSCGNITRPP